MEKKEILSIIGAIIIFAVVLMFNENILDFNKFYLIIPIVILLVFVVAQKITANYLDVSIEVTNWEMSRWWISKWAQLKKAIPVGIIFPILLGFLSGGAIKMLTLLQFNATALPSKAVKKYGTRRISGIMEWDDALIAFYGILAVMIIGLIANFISYSFFPFKTLAKYSLYYIIWNLVPFGKLSGSKLFFGSYGLYIFTLIITLLAGLIILY